MKCVFAIQEKEIEDSSAVGLILLVHIEAINKVPTQQYHIILLGGLSGRLDHTIHTLSYLHKLRKTRERVFAVTDENIGWVLDQVIFSF